MPAAAAIKAGTKWRRAFLLCNALVWAAQCQAWLGLHRLLAAAEYVILFWGWIKGGRGHVTSSERGYEVCLSPKPYFVSVVAHVEVVREVKSFVAKRETWLRDKETLVFRSCSRNQEAERLETLASCW